MIPSLISTNVLKRIIFSPLNLRRIFSIKNLSNLKKVENVFHYYKGPGGLRRRDNGGNLEIFNINTKEWISTNNSVHHRAIEFDSIAITKEQALIYERKLSLKKD